MAYQYNDIINGDETGLSNSVTGNPVVEPLQGPLTVEDVIDRFPEQIYQQGKDTHLYRFLEALCGDAGAGYLKKQSYYARLVNEGQYLTFKELDNFYSTHFKFRRLRSETYDIDTDVDNLTEAEWDALKSKDESYRHRVQDLFFATRLGSSPDGMQHAAQAGTGVDAEIVEHYKYLYDLYSDDPLGLDPVGHTISTNEFVVMTEILERDNTPKEDVTFNAAVDRQSVIEIDTLPVYDNKEDLRAALTRPQVNEGWTISPGLDSEDPDTYAYPHLNPDLERNMIEVMDRLRPVGALITVEGQQRRFDHVTPNANPFATSERFFLSRFITGSAAIQWPDVDRSNAFFVVSEEERQMIHGGQALLMPAIFLSIETVHAYTNIPVTDGVEDTYNTSAFYEDINNQVQSAPFNLYQSEFSGRQALVIQKLFPFMKFLSEDFTARKGLALRDTPFLFEGRVY